MIERCMFFMFKIFFMGHEGQGTLGLHGVIGAAGDVSKMRTGIPKGKLWLSQRECIAHPPSPTPQPFKGQ